ncbi:MAG: hypothetical protein M0R23_10665 [Bacteroidales bacterium]|jgi:hypothetical protein|nr:hypothetical protein [Bacteroidales bacterium]
MKIRSKISKIDEIWKFALIGSLLGIILFSVAIHNTSKSNEDSPNLKEIIEIGVNYTQFDRDAIKAIVGESASEGYEGMLAISRGIRNRGNLGGVNGLYSEHIKYEPEYIFKLAEQAWDESKYRKIHDGNYWGGTKIDKDWIERMENSGYIKVYEIGNHVFYKK